ncbi:sensor domain-containing diguanylate cyclase [Nitrospina gracilis]|uniref:sensor domain-containing diguanylate cyclase n=1 Tax=Nitrospina gracilis TaxID=35801 RepID=UPI001F39EAE3|nr:sensor domain-containing diguanylate cyclase [Nitrospina gracilis]MCF8721517.1 diguanylate cyclase (GGDEF)-like protein [Nitrospina gracilis Nb-211]
MDPIDQIKLKETRQVLELVKHQKDMLGESLVSLDLFLYLHKSISLLHLDDIKPVLLEKLPHILAIRYFSLFLYNPSQMELTLASSNHLNMEKPLSFSVSESGVMQDALNQKRYIFESDFTTSKYFKGRRNPLFRNNFFLCVPLMIENKIIGVINVNDSEKGFLSVSDMDYILNVLEFVALSVSNALLHEKTEMLSITDGLTQLYDHRQMMHILGKEFDRCKRYQSPLSLLMMDIDNFKSINDTYGHQKGDEVLVALATVMNRLCRSNDTAARYGGEEFAVVLPETDKQGAKVIAERIRQGMAKVSFNSGNSHEFGVTVSGGIAELNLSTMSSVSDLIQAADRALYQAKERGRDRVVLGG